VLPDRVSILAPMAETAEEIDLARAEAAKRRAEERLQKAVPEIDFERARMALIRSIGRLDAAKYARSRR
jgi:F-type H+-transporting ATPase subunit epsilon